MKGGFIMSLVKIEEMIDFCEKENIFYFCDLVNYARKERKDWFREIIKKDTTRFMAFYIADRAYQAGKINKEMYDYALEDLNAED